MTAFNFSLKISIPESQSRLWQKDLSTFEKLTNLAVAVRRKTFAFAGLLVFTFCQNLQAQTLRGAVLDAVSGEKLAGASLEIFLPGETEKLAATAADEFGEYLFEDLKSGDYELAVSSLGYENQRVTEVFVAAGKEEIVNFRLAPAAQNLTEATIAAALPRLPRTIGETALTSERVNRHPAMFFDPARLVAAYPGAVNTNDGTNHLSIRGNSPASIGWRLEGAEIINPNHLPNAGIFTDAPSFSGGGVLMFSAQMLDNSSFLTGSFPMNYTNAIGGIMDLNLRTGNNQNHEFTAQAGLLGLDLAAEGPITRGNGSSYLMNLRYSTVGLLGRMGVSFGDEQISFSDYAGTFNFPRRKGGNLKLFFMGGHSENFFEAKADSSEAKTGKDFYNIDFQANTWLIGFSRDRRMGPNTRMKNTLVMSGATTRRDVYNRSHSFEDNNSFNAPSKISGSFTLNRQLNEVLNLKIGLNPTLFLDELSADYLWAQPFGEFNWRLLGGRLNIQAGIGFFFQVDDDNLNPEGRLFASYKPSERHVFSISAGNTSFLQPSYTFYGIEYGYYPIRTEQISVGHRWNFRRGTWALKSEAFFQKLSNVTVISGTNRWELNEPETFNNVFLNSNMDGLGRNFGLELGLERHLSNGIFANANVSIFDSKFKMPDANDWKSTRWDFGHTFNLSAGKEWRREISETKTKSKGFSARAVWTGGQREAPVDPAQSWELQTAYDYSAGFGFQNPDYFRLDARFFMKTFVAERFNTALALEFQNLTNRKNVAWHFYNTVSKKVERQFQLGIIPNLSWRIEF